MFRGEPEIVSEIARRLLEEGQRPSHIESWLLKEHQWRVPRSAFYRLCQRLRRAANDVAEGTPLPPAKPRGPAARTSGGTPGRPASG